MSSSKNDGTGPKFNPNFKIPTKRPPETISELTGGTNSFMIAKVESLDMASINWNESEANQDQPEDPDDQLEETETEQTEEIELGEYQITDIPLPPSQPPPPPPPQEMPIGSENNLNYGQYTTESYYGDQAYTAYTVPPPPVFDSFPKLELGPQLYQSPLFNLDEAYMGSGDSIHRMALPLKDQVEARKRKSMDSVIDLCIEETYPEQLKLLMKPLVCSLCNSSMNSVISSKMHYQSKQHEKKIVAWLDSWFAKTGERIERKRIRVAQPVEGPTGPDAFHCKVCDLKLTSVPHANQHYMGKKHRMAAAGRKNPAGSGYWHEGIWIRQQTKVTTDSRFGIGSSFVPTEQPPPPLPSTDLEGHISEPVNPTANTENKVSSSTPPATSVRSAPDMSKFCEICMITVTSDSQMKMHLEGVKHAKKLKTMGK
jgi:Zinc-finger of C2H2 type